MPSKPPQTIILEPDQTAVWESRPVGAPAVAVVVHESLAGSYWPPVFELLPSTPPQTIILEPVQTAVWELRPVGAPAVAVVVHESLTGSYWPPVFELLKSKPPQTIILEPVQTAVWEDRPVGAPIVEVLATQKSWPAASSVYPAPTNVVSPWLPKIILPGGTPPPLAPGGPADPE